MYLNKEHFKSPKNYIWNVFCFVFHFPTFFIWTIIKKFQLGNIPKFQFFCKYFISRIPVSEQLSAKDEIPAESKAAFTAVKGVEECGVRKDQGLVDVIPRITGKLNYVI